MHWIIIIAYFFAWASPAEKFVQFDRCGMIRHAVESDIAQKEFFICSGSQDTFQVYDAVSFLPTCKDKEICEGRWLIITHDGTVNLNQPNVLHLYNVEYEGSNCFLYVSRPFAKKIIRFQYKILRNEFRLDNWKVSSM